MNNLSKRMPLISGIGFGLAFLCSSVATAQPSEIGMDEPPILPGVAEPPRIQGITTEMPGNFHFPPKMKTQMEQTREQIKQLGFVKVDDARVLQLDMRSIKIKEGKGKTEVKKSISKVRSNLGFEPADLRFSPLSKAELLEVVPAGAYNNEKWSEVNQLFRVKGFGLVSLNEWAYKSSGGMYVDPEGINQNVNGRQALLLVEKAPSGRGLTHLTWWDEEKVYQLMVNRPLMARPQVDKFIQLAESIQ